MANNMDTPILVLGMMQRTGTNFVARALWTHRDTTAPETLFEDFLVSRLDDFEAYWSGVVPGWGDKNPPVHKLPEFRLKLGEALIGIINEDRKDKTKRAVFKTPTVDGLPVLRRYFPDSPVIVITRDGPSVIQSGMKSFGWQFDKSAWRWKGAAEKVLAAEKAIAEEGARPFIRLRYEDAAPDPAAAIKRLAADLDLDPDGFDHAELADMPVYGSSATREESSTVHWKPVEKTKDFDPLKRAADWSPAAYRRFDYLTGGLSAKLGYDLPHTYRGGALAKLEQGLRGRLLSSPV